MTRIAIEEHFICPEAEGYLIAAERRISAGRIARINTLIATLSDVGEQRLKAMDAGGISRAVLSLCGPGVQAERDPAVAVRVARICNDRLAEAIAGHPARYSGFAHLPMQDAAAAADELERCVTQLGFVGALINGHTSGTYLDAPALEVFWERAAALDAPVYLHPAYAPTLPEAFSKPAELSGALWGWMAETGGHALRLMLNGVFDRHPGAKVVLGHMGESLPFQHWRLDRGYEKLDPALRPQHPPTWYMARNLWITTSGLPSTPALDCAIATMGAGRVLFAADYPFEDCAVAGNWLDSVPSSATRAAIAAGNARTLFERL